MVGAVIFVIVFNEPLEAAAIGVVISINVGIGFFMELQANRSMEALKKLSIQFATVIKNGEVQRIN